MKILQDIFLAVVGYSSGVVIAGGVFAFIAVIGVVPRFAKRTNTQNRLRLYEDMIVLGGIFGCLTMFIDYKFSSHHIIVAIASLCIGIFVGSLSVSLAEILNVMPIFMRRARLTKGLSIFVTVMALGKMLGSLMYFYLPYFK